MNAFIGYKTPDTVLNSVEAKINLSDEYLSTFGVLLEHDASVKLHSLPGMFLLSHSLELLLKAFVEMVSQENPRTFNHGIGKLWKKAKEYGLLNEASTRRLRVDYFVQLLKDGHENYQFRYLDKSLEFPDAAETHTEIQFLREAIILEFGVRRLREKAEVEKRGMVMGRRTVGARISTTREQ